MGCGNCPDNEQQLGLTGVVPLGQQPQVAPRVSRVVFQPVSPPNPLAQLKHVLPPDDGQRRDFGHPTFHSDGSIEYPKREGDWEPPPVPNGYERDAQNKWQFHPLWQPCVFRLYGLKQPRQCGCIDVIAICNHPDAPQFGKYVKHASDCATCPIRT